VLVHGNHSLRSDVAAISAAAAAWLPDVLAWAGSATAATSAPMRSRRRWTTSPRHG